MQPEHILRNPKFMQILLILNDETDFFPVYGLATKMNVSISYMKLQLCKPLAECGLLASKFSRANSPWAATDRYTVYVKITPAGRLLLSKYAETLRVITDALASPKQEVYDNRGQDEKIADHLTKGEPLDDDF